MMSFVDKDQLEPNCSVLLHNKVLSVVGILATLEEQYGIMVDDDEIDAEVFATVGSLTAFVESKLG